MKIYFSQARKRREETIERIKSYAMMAGMIGLLLFALVIEPLRASMHTSSVQVAEVRR